MKSNIMNTGLIGTRRTKVACAILGALALSACSQEISSEGVLAESNDELYLDGLTWPSGNVNVCFSGTDGNNPTLIAEAQRLLNASWVRAANLSFVGWGQCNLAPSPSGNFSTIALHFCGASSTSADCPASNYDNGVRQAGAFRGQSRMGRVNPTGPFGGNFTPGVTNLSLISDDTSSLLTRFRYQVIHEFGHALGYRHEQDRPDNFTATGSTIYCHQSANKATTGSAQTSFFDLASIMDYCATDPLTGGSFPTMLSNGDILGVRVAYGRRTASHGFMIQSDTNSGLAVNAFGGAFEGTVIKLHDACTITNPDCTWTYQRGMLVSDADPSLAINAWGGAAEGTVLKLTRACTPSNPDCTWTYKGGQFLSDTNAALAINAGGGAQLGTTLVTTAACTAANPDCTWTMPNVMLSSNRNSSLAVNAVGGAVNHTALSLHNGCDASNGDCTFTFSKGMLISTTNSTLAVNALGGAQNLGTVEINNLCAATNPDCTWTWKKGQLISDNQANGILPIKAVGGASHLTALKLASGCSDTNPDCVFSGLFAKN
jgi:hypothetical protein